MVCREKSHAGSLEKCTQIPNHSHTPINTEVITKGKHLITLFAASSSYNRLSICLTIFVWACSKSRLSRSCRCWREPCVWKHFKAFIYLRAFGCISRNKTKAKTNKKASQSTNQSKSEKLNQFQQNQTSTPDVHTHSYPVIIHILSTYFLHDSCSLNAYHCHEKTYMTCTC